MDNHTSIFEKGYTIIDFQHCEWIEAIQKQVKTFFGPEPLLLHEKNIDQQERIELIKKGKDAITESGYVKKLILANRDCFLPLLGPDIDIQSSLYLRVSRPNVESDFIDWHRDTFYGNSFWELNFWFPIFPLENNAGLTVVEGSHLLPVNNVQHIQDQDVFRKQVTKGSVASEVGYQYAPKCDDTIRHMDMSRVRLLMPAVGQAVLFFGHIVHRAQNHSTKTRISIDTRIKHMLAPTNTKPGYYQPLLRSDVARCIEKMQLIEQQEVVYGN